LKVKRERFEKISYVVGHHKNNCVHMLVMIKIKWACKGFDWLTSRCFGRVPVVTVRVIQRWQLLTGNDNVVHVDFSRKAVALKQAA